ncbi:MAG TPA: methyltransferase [Patescibacteria group bacterium]|jgi:predicted O-methyltransferase YrrM|nr:methyltransferase [Patescibacteria group bacterium]
METLDIEKLFKAAEKHIAEHQCSAHPYKHGDRLVEYIIARKPKRILEIGTGVGYTSVLMAIANPQAHIDTLEKDLTHAKTAKKYFKDKNVTAQISVINDFAETVLPMMDKQYDFIFFDGFQIHYEFLPQYKRLLKHGGILFLANNHLKSKTSDQFFAELSDKKVWNILEQFDDTSIVERS